ncbi:hypothetical protein R1flu_022438 [Riccia fluitans]|uniref:Uncharacterized protein n=1 Tax=Riccia fluitans TaxID=41844 RepID=A0ABD1XP97_9MARC
MASFVKTPSVGNPKFAKCWLDLRYSRNAPGVGCKRARCWLGWNQGLRWIQKGASVRCSRRVDMRECWKGSKCWLFRVEMHQVMKGSSVGQSGELHFSDSRAGLPGPCRVLDDRVALLARLLNLHAEPKEVPESPWTKNGLQVSIPGRREDAPDELRDSETRYRFSHSSGAAQHRTRRVRLDPSLRALGLGDPRSISASRAQDSRDSRIRKVTHLPLCSTEPEKVRLDPSLRAQDSGTPGPKRYRQDPNLARAGLQTPGILDSCAKPGNSTTSRLHNFRIRPQNRLIL